MIFTIPYDTPSKKNSRIVNRRTGRSFPSKAYSDWHVMASLWIRTHYSINALGKGPFSVSMAFNHGTLRRCDSDNKASSILDLLVDLGVIEDDSWQVVRSLSVTNYYEKAMPSVTVKIFPYTEEFISK